jgi:hypothetical protein
MTNDTGFTGAVESVKSFFQRKEQPTALDRALAKRQHFNTHSKPGEVLLLEEDEMKALMDYDKEHAPQVREVKDNAPVPAPKTQASIVDATLAERGGRYGLFTENSRVYAQLMQVIYTSPNMAKGKLSPATLHALGNISTKLARLLTGDPDYYDNWRDIAGYATLMDAICRGEER